MIKQLLLLLFALNFALANLTDEAQTAYDAGDEQRAAQIWQKACDTGELAGCDSLASLYQSSGEHAKAAAIFERACEKGFGLSCYNLAQIYEASVGVAPDESKALSLYVKACEHGYGVVCYYPGGIYESGQAKMTKPQKTQKTRSNFTRLPARAKFTKRARL